MKNGVRSSMIWKSKNDDMIEMSDLNSVVWVNRL